MIAEQTDWGGDLSHDLLFSSVAPDWLAPRLKIGREITDRMARAAGVISTGGTTTAAVAQDERAAMFIIAGRCRIALSISVSWLNS